MNQYPKGIVRNVNVQVDICHDLPNGGSRLDPKQLTFSDMKRNFQGTVLPRDDRHLVNLPVEEQLKQEDNTSSSLLPSSGLSFHEASLKRLNERCYGKLPVASAMCDSCAIKRSYPELIKWCTDGGRCSIRS